jgi:autotransporter translocation and assembly factor TamB
MCFLITALRSTFYSLLLLFILVIGLLTFLVTTTPGLYTTAKLAAIFLPGQLHFDQLEGHLSDHVSLKHLHYQDQQLTMELSNFQLKWQIKTLFHHQVILEHLYADKLTINLNPKKANTERTNIQLPQLPFALSIKDIFIKQIKLSQASDVYQIDDIHLQAWLAKKQWKIKKMAINLNQIAIIATATLQPQPPFATSAALQFKSSNKTLPLDGRLDLGGDFSLYHWHGEFTNPALLTLNGILRNGHEFHTSAQWQQITWPLYKKHNLQISKGELHLDGQLSNLTLNHLSLKSNLTAHYLDNLLQAIISCQFKAQHWEAQGSITSNGKALTVEGKGDLSPTFRGKITIAGDNVALMSTPEYRINFSPNLNFEFTPVSLTIKGTLLIPHAQIKPQSFHNSISLTEDAVFVGNEQPLPNPLHIETDIRVEMGDDVAIDVEGLHGFLTGAIHLRQLPQGPLTASGALNVRDGRYKAYGQDLTIKQGQLLFTGGVIDNPGIYVRAVRQFTNADTLFAGSNELLDFNAANVKTVDFGSKTTVGIEVTGRLNSPKVTLFSNPATLSQADILSLLLLGKPVNRANQAGGQLLLAAISSMNLDSGSGGLQLIDQVKQTLGLDFNLQTNSKYNQYTKQMTEQKSVMVGKSLFKRLYLSYNVGLAQADSNVLTITYLLNKFFSIQVNTSLTASGIDLLYTPRVYTQE